MDKLYFLTAGVPLRAGTKGYKKVININLYVSHFKSVYLI